MNEIAIIVQPKGRTWKFLFTITIFKITVIPEWGSIKGIMNTTHYFHWLIFHSSIMYES